MLKVEVTINGVRTARMIVQNTSDLADISNYDYFISENSRAGMKILPMRQTGSITNHDRNQSVWNLVMAVLRNVNGE